MKSTGCWMGLFVAVAFTVGCATNTSPTHLTINTAEERGSAEGRESEEISFSDEQSEVLTALAVLHSEVVALRRQVSALEGGEPAEEMCEAAERVAAREASCDDKFAPARFEEPVEVCEASPEKTRTKTETDSDLRRTLEQAITAQRTALQTIANNLANANTPAYKRARVNFEDAGYRTQVLPGVQDSSGNSTSVGIATGLGSRVSSIQTDFSQGVLRQTDRQLDVAIEGNGFFQVQDPSGQIHYTRAGNFSINANQQLVLGSASTGRIVDPPITIPQDSTNVVIEAGGRVMVQQANNPTLQNAGNIQLAMFTNREGLLKKGENLYAQSDASNTPIQVTPGLQGAGTLRQNMLEASNVDPEAEMREWRAAERQLKRLKKLLAD